MLSDWPSEVIVDGYLRKLIVRFPDRQLQILRLCRKDPVFRAVCEEIEMAETAKARWKDIPERALEYRRILDRLENEFWEHLSSSRR